LEAEGLTVRYGVIRQSDAGVLERWVETAKLRVAVYGRSRPALPCPALRVSTASQYAPGLKD
jgi:hypothetical protein